MRWCRSCKKWSNYAALRARSISIMGRVSGRLHKIIPTIISREFITQTFIHKPVILCKIWGHFARPIKNYYQHLKYLPSLICRRLDRIKFSRMAETFAMSAAIKEIVGARHASTHDKQRRPTLNFHPRLKTRIKNPTEIFTTRSASSTLQ